MLQNIKNKKILFFGFLVFFFFAAFLFNTQIAQAQTVGDITKEVGKCSESWGVTNAVKATVAGFVDLVAYIPEVLAILISKISDWIISKVLGWPITTGTDGAAIAFQSGWASVKDLANMLIVLGFVIIGLATTLRIREYEAKKFLVSLIVVALLINFSNVFCGIVIDASNITMRGLVAGGTTAGMAESLRQNVKLQEGRLKCTAITQGDLTTYITVSIIFSIIYSILALVFVYLMVLFLARYAMLGLLFILSPIAIVFSSFPFPKVKDLWSSWLNNFLKWSFIGVSLCFFLNIAAQTLKALNVTASTTFFDLIGYLLVVLGIIFVGIKISVKGSGAVGLAAKGLALGVGGFAFGSLASVTGAKGLAGLASRAGTGIKDAASGASEKYLGRFSPVQQGTTAANKQARLSEAKKRLENIKDDEQLAKIAQRGGVATKQGALEKAAAAQILAERKAFGKIDPRQREAVAAHAKAMGVSPDTFTKVRPETYADVSKQDATQMFVGKNIEAEVNRRMAAGESRQQAELNASFIKPNADELTQAKTELRNRRITENALGIGPTSDTDVRNKLIENRQKQLIADAKMRGETLLPADALKQAKDYKPSEYEISTMRETLSQERIQKAFGKLSPAKAAELPTEAVSSKTISLFSDKQFLEIGRKGTPGLIAEVKKYMKNPSLPANDPGQSDGYKELRTLAATYPIGSEERKKINHVLYYLSRDPNFK